MEDCGGGGVREDEQGVSGCERSLNSIRFYKNSGRQMSGDLRGSRDLAFMAVFHIVWHGGAVKEVIFSLMAPPMSADHIWDHSGVSKWEDPLDARGRIHLLSGGNKQTAVRRLQRCSSQTLRESGKIPFALTLKVEGFFSQFLSSNC